MKQNRMLDGEMKHHKELKGIPNGSRFVSPYLLRPQRTYAEALADLRAPKQQALPPDQPPCDLTGRSPSLILGTNLKS